VKIFFAEPDYFIHGTEDEESIGRAASHGCIRMRNEDAIALARLVMEQAGDARPPAWYRRVLNRVTRTEEVRLPRPIPIRIQQRMAAGE
jgi:murein L,D-transpeptidase YcbB/YkuD